MLVGIEVEEHDVDILLGAPAAVAAIAGTVARPYHGLAAQRPLGIGVAVAAVGQVVNLAPPVGTDQRHVRAVPAAIADIAAQQPAAVRAPLEPQVTVGIGILILAIEHRTHGLGLEVHDAQVATVLEEGDLLAVGTVLGLLAGLVGLRQPFLGQLRGVGKLLLVLVDDAGAVNLPHAVALGSVGDAASVGGKGKVALLLRGIGNLPGGLIVDGCHVDVAVHDKSYLLVLGRQADVRGPAGLQLAYHVTVVAVGHNADADLLLPAVAIGVYLAVVAVAQGAVARCCEEADRILLMVGQLLLARTVNIALPDVEGSVALRQVVERLSVRSPDGRAVLAAEGGQTGELPAALAGAGLSHQPDVAGDSTLVMLAEGVFIAFVVVVEHVALAVDADALHGDEREHAGASSLSADLIDLREDGLRQQTGPRRRHLCAVVQHVPIVPEGHGNLVGTMGGQTGRHPSPAVDDVHIEATLAVGGKGYLLSVRAPHRVGVISRIGGQLPCLSASGRNGVEVSLIAEGYGLCVGRYGTEAHPQRTVLRRNRQRSRPQQGG